MAKPAFFRYLPARLKPLSSPAVWAPLTIFTLTSIFIWEWYQNPDWFNRPQASEISPEATLTPAEEAQRLEREALDTLLEGTTIPAELPALTELEASGSQPAGLTSEAKAGRELANKENPFAAYEQEYEFSGSANASQSTILTPSTALPGSGQANGGQSNAAASSSALSDALLRQARQDSGQPPTNGQASSELSFDGSASATFSGGSNNAAETPSGFSSAPTGNSIAAPYIRTTTDMSPPIGTTGYQVPASAELPVFNVAPQQPSRNPYSNSPAFSSPGTQQNFGQSFGQNAAPTPTAAPLPNVAPAGSYTAPSFAQPEQNRKVR